MQALISQLMLPLTLAGIMFVIGLELRVNDFRQIFLKPKIVFLGLGLQMIMLPLLALILTLIIPLGPIAAAGLILVSLCPGGATSNLFSYLAKGDIALSVILTGLVSLISPIVLPLVFIGYLQLFDSSAQVFSLPLLTTIKQLSAVTLAPIIIGMSIRRSFPNWTESASPTLKKIAGLMMLFIIGALIATNPDTIKGMLSYNALAAILLSICAFSLAFKITQISRLPIKAQRTITIEVGVQNAGTAMMIALTIMHKPELASIPLIYGLLMNIPAIAFAVWTATSSKQNHTQITTGPQQGK